MKKSKMVQLIVGITLIVGAALAGIFLFLGEKKEDAYRNIRVTQVVGDVTLNRKDIKALKVTEQMNLLSGDELLTGNDAKVTLWLDDDKYIVVDENSKLLLFATGTAEDSKTKLELEYGAVFSDIKSKLSEGSYYEVITPSSTMSVRGTQFEVAYHELKDAFGKVIGKQAEVLTFEGAVQVAPEGKEEEARVSSPGTMEVLVEQETGEVQFESETKPIEAENLREFTAVYLKEDIAKNIDEMSEEEKKAKEELLEKVDVYLEEILPVKKEEEKKEEETVKNPAKADIRYFVPLIMEDFGNIKVTDVAEMLTTIKPYILNADGISTETVFLDAPISSYLEPEATRLLEEYVSDDVAKNYGEDAEVHFRGLYDTNGTYYSVDGTENLSGLGVVDGSTLELYAAYRVDTPDGEINMVPCILDIEMVVEGFSLERSYIMTMPAGDEVSLPEIPDFRLQWTQDGEVLKTGSVMISEGKVNRYGLSVTQK